MPYDKAPEKIKALPEHAQTVWVSAFNSAHKQYKGDESKANATAWSAVKKAGYEQDADGKWHKVSKIIVKDEKRRFTLGVVYEPDALDTDAEFTDAAELEKACHDFMRELQGRRGLAKAGLDILAKVKEAADSDAEVRLEVDEALDEIAKRGVNAMHAEDLDNCEVVECYIAPADMTIGEQAIKRGTWLAGIIWAPEHFEKIQNGEWTGYSMGGTAHKVKGE